MVIEKIVASHQFSYDKAHWSQIASCLETKLRANWFAIICLVDSLENLSCDISLYFIFFTAKQPEEYKKATVPRTLSAGWNIYLYLYVSLDGLSKCAFMMQMKCNVAVGIGGILGSIAPKSIGLVRRVE
jgi:hypothetical protein